MQKKSEHAPEQHSESRPHVQFISHNEGHQGKFELPTSLIKCFIVFKNSYILLS